MKLQDLVEKFIKNPSEMRRGAGFMSKRYKMSTDDIKKARELAKSSLESADFYQTVDIPTTENTLTTSGTTEDVAITELGKPKLVKEKVSENGDRDLEILSDKPLSREEIEKEFHIDNISTTLSNYWNKATPSGRYLVSAFIKCHHNNFHSEEQLREKLKSMLIDTEPTLVKKAVSPSEKICIVYLSDEHVGALNHVDDVHGNFYSSDIYIGRLEQVVQEVLDLESTYEKLYIINLGDEADSQLDKMTTRKGHVLPSESGKVQFDIYIKGRRMLFESIFSSGVSAEYEVINCNNSNHSGNDLSYIWNRAVEIWLEARFPEVIVKNVTKYIDCFEYGKHVVAFAHGKDDKDMGKNWPLQINTNVDGWIMQWFDRKGYSSSRNWLHVRKGDLHSLNVSMGKFGDYISMPSVYGSSSWIGLNFGLGRPGAYIEVLSKKSPSVTNKFIWF